MAIDVDTDSFEKEVLHSEVPVLVDFWGPQCAPCLALMPQVEKMGTTYGGKLKISKIDASKNRRLCLTLKVMALPTFLFYNKGQEVDRLTGQALRFEEIEASAKKIIDES